MAVKRIIVHRIKIEDKPGSLHKLLSSIAAEGVDLLCLTACSCCDGNSGAAYLSAKDPSLCEACAAKTGIEATEAVGFIINGDDKTGAAAEALKGLADAGINGIAGAAMVCDGKYQLLVVVDAADGDSAEKALS